MKSNKKKVSIGIVLFLIIAAIAAAVFIIHKSKGEGREVHPLSDISAENAVYYCQSDENWENDRLGDSRFTMSNSGCLTTCLSAALTMQGIENIDPAALNGRFSADGVYDTEGNIQWETAEKSLGRSIARYDALSAEELDELLKSGTYPIVRVKLSGGIGHFVLLTGSKNEEYLCMDPLKDNEKPVPLSQFGSRIYWVRYLQ